MNIVLLKTPSAFDAETRGRDLTVFPLAIYHLAGLLHRAGFGVRTVDPTEINESYIFDALQEFANVDVVGLSVNTFNLGTTRDLVRRLKELHPDVACVVGGVHPSHSPESTLRFVGADYALAGEADRTLVAFCQALEAGDDLSSVPGLHRLTSDGRYAASSAGTECPEIESVPWTPYLVDLPPGVYHMAPYETSRGCRFHCTFCSIFATRNWRGRSPASVLETLGPYVEAVGDRVQSNGVLFTDDCFTGDPDRAAAVLAGIHRSGLATRLMFEARVTDLLKRPHLMDRIAEVRPYGLEMGIECGYDEGLRKIRKGLTVAQVSACLAALRDRELTRSVRLSFIIGLPFETFADIERTLAFAAYCMEEYDCTTSTAWWIPAPSRLWDELRSYGMIPQEEHFHEPHYQRDPLLFRHYHANVSQKDVERARKLLQFYYSMGLSLLDIRTMPVNRPRPWRERSLKV